MMTRTLLSISFALAATVSYADDRVALIIGNSAYTEVAALQNPKNDATDLAAELSQLGFSVEKVLDADRRGMESSIDRFVKRISSESAALFHYSGHGMQVQNENYLIPVDFRMTDEASVKFDAVSASKVHERMLGAGARLSMLVLDACRNNGFALSRASGGGLAMMTAGKGSFLAFSTAPGRTASDNPDGRNGLFTAYFIEGLRTPGLSLDRLFSQVRERTYEASGEEQLPWTSSSVIGDFIFARATQRQMVHGDAVPVQIAQAPASTPAVVQAPRVQTPAPPQRSGQSNDPGAVTAVEDSYDKLMDRAYPVRESLERLRSQQAASGLGLRGDMASAESSMDSNLGRAADAISDSNLAEAQRRMRIAEGHLEKLEKFLGL